MVMDEAFRFASGNDVLLTLGIKPDRPETGYGYIQANTMQPVAGYEGLHNSSWRAVISTGTAVYSSGRLQQYWNRTAGICLTPSIHSMKGKSCSAQPVKKSL